MSEKVQCGPAKDPSVRGMILVIGLFLVAGWFIYDATISPSADYVPLSEDANKYMRWAFNFYGQFAAGIAAVVALVIFVRFKKRLLTADDQELRYGNVAISWSDVTLLDASELKSKEILVLQYGDGESLKLDGWKLDNFKALVALIDEKIPADKRKS